MSTGNVSPIRTLWLRFSHWLRAWRNAPALLTAGLPSSARRSNIATVFGTPSVGLPPSILDDLEVLVPYHPGVVTSTVISALADVHDLRTLLNGPARRDIVEDVSILGETEALLGALIARACQVAVLAQVAGTRNDDRQAREAAGAAILELQDRQNLLKSLVSSAVRWASSQASDDLEHYKQCARDVQISSNSL